MNDNTIEIRNGNVSLPQLEVSGLAPIDSTNIDELAMMAGALENASPSGDAEELTQNIHTASARKNASFDWQTKSCESRMDQVSPDGRWHLDTKTEDGKTRLYLTNFDILCSPSAFGANARECWEKFIRDCDGYAEKLAMIRDEAAAILASLEQHP